MTLHVPVFLERVKTAKTRIRQVTADEARVLARAGTLVIDVRDEDEFGRGHIEGAIQIDGDSLVQRIVDVAPDQATSILCYCSRGYRAALAVDALQRLGYRNVASIEGGLQAYLSSGKELSSVYDNAGNSTKVRTAP